MPNSGSGTTTEFDPIASYARLSERVDNQGKDLTNLRSIVDAGFRTVEHSIQVLSQELRGNSRTQWPVIWSAIGVSFTVIAAIGSLAYWPILNNQSRLEAAFVRLGELSVTRQEMEWRQARGQEDRLRMESSISGLRADQVQRAEHERVWQNYDQRLADHQRQLDEIKQASSSVYGQRDALMDMRERLDRLERERARLAAPSAP